MPLVYLDHNVYPGIFDRVLAYASDSALAVVLRTSTETGQQAARLLYRELQIAPTSPGPVLGGHCFVSDKQATGSTPPASRLALSAHTERYLKFAQIVTTCTHSPVPELGVGESAQVLDGKTILPDLRVWRYTAPALEQCCGTYQCHPLHVCAYARIFAHAEHIVIIDPECTVDQWGNILLDVKNISTRTSPHITLEIPLAIPDMALAAPGEFAVHFAGDSPDTKRSVPQPTFTFVFSGLPDWEENCDNDHDVDWEHVRPLVTQLVELAIIPGVTVQVVGAEHFDAQTERQAYPYGDMTLEEAVKREMESRYGTSPKEGERGIYTFVTLEAYIDDGQGMEAFGEARCQLMRAKIPGKTSASDGEAAEEEAGEV